MASISGLKTTLVEGVRYRGNIGHWSWVAHRLSGLGILGFLTIHVWDTANAAFAPAVYSWSVDVFKHPFFGIGEIAVFGAVLYHAFNGIRITLLDFKPEWWRYQTRSAYITWALFLLLFVPLAIYLLVGTVTHCNELVSEGLSCWTLPTLADYQVSPVGYDYTPHEGLLTYGLISLVVALIISAVVVVVRRGMDDDAVSQLERRAYLFMRMSGIALLLLAVGHVMLQLILNDVHNLTLIYVAEQWDSWGWKAYDMFLLVFAVTHGYNGLRNILEDYIHNEGVMRAINYVLPVFVVFTILWSAVAIATFPMN